MIPRFAARSWFFSVPYDDFDEVSLHKVAPPYDSRYLLMAQDVCEQVLAVCKKSQGAHKVEVIFNDNLSVSKRIRDNYRTLKNRSKGTDAEYLYSDVMPVLPAFLDEKLPVLLQDAEILAWFMRRILSGERVSNSHSDVMKVFESIKSVEIGHFHDDIEILKEGKREILESVPKGK